MFVEMVHHPTTKGEILMKKRVLSALMALLLLIPAAGSAEEAPMLLESYASRGARQVTFAYPEGCTVEVAAEHLQTVTMRKDRLKTGYE